MRVERKEYSKHVGSHSAGCACGFVCFTSKNICYAPSFVEFHFDKFAQLAFFGVPEMDDAGIFGADDADNEHEV